MGQAERRGQVVLRPRVCGRRAARRGHHHRGGAPGRERPSVPLLPRPDGLGRGEPHGERDPGRLQYHQHAHLRSTVRPRPGSAAPSASAVELPNGRRAAGRLAAVLPGRRRAADAGGRRAVQWRVALLVHHPGDILRGRRGVRPGDVRRQAGEGAAVQHAARPGGRRSPASRAVRVRPLGRNELHPSALPAAAVRRSFCDTGDEDVIESGRGPRCRRRRRPLHPRDGRGISDKLPLVGRMARHLQHAERDADAAPARDAHHTGDRCGPHCIRLRNRSMASRGVHRGADQSAHVLRPLS